MCNPEQDEWFNYFIVQDKTWAALQQQEAKVIQKVQSRMTEPYKSQGWVAKSEPKPLRTAKLKSTYMDITEDIAIYMEDDQYFYGNFGARFPKKEWTEV